MKSVLSILLLFCFQIGTAQITRNPKVKEKSSQDTYINRITITDDYTIVSMQFVSKSVKESLKEYLDNNPDEKEQLSRMNPMMRNLILQQMAEDLRIRRNQTISIQPNSYLESNDGRTFQFIKATNIPVAPERLPVEPEEKYFFRVYFEKLDPGIEQVNLIESDRRAQGQMSYWNFYGVEVNNPANGGETVEEPEEENESVTAMPEEKSETFLLSGKVYNAETNEPISAKIVCKINDKEKAYDSLFTSRSGYYEFLLKPENFVYIISAPGFEPYEQALDLKNWNKAIEQDFYLEPIEKETSAEPIENSRTESPAESNEDMERVDEKTFRLNHVYFFTGKAEISNSSYRELNKLLEMMLANPEMKIRVDGHTDNQGDPELNMDLSERRAQAVRKYLIDGGVEEERIEYKGWGETKPLTQNRNEIERQKNRRVEIVILD
ncbi:OmpA family protein [Jiulongibacter sediminis]|uniref:OmpA-like domain-containing protein n=1 Tax=Jiulongibacter sediminis TaxID=1605367 RepID=A0A0P7BGC7_9BACT|nr:OmpA family protein [Jiulongibacter sediminis]KPM50030.1 hypothetical protein AFM12_05650 [Jiulongibacter sediminis]TBX27058.1 hypothetical protein TK44_05655 [Jiulongibacter sediminis]